MSAIGLFRGLRRSVSRNVVKVNNTNSNRVQVRYMGGGGHGHHEPHIPEFHDNLGKFCLVTAFFWIMYQARENKGQLFGLYQPWLHEHAHDHTHFEQDDLNSPPKVAEHHDDDEEHDDE